MHYCKKSGCLATRNLLFDVLVICSAVKQLLKMPTIDTISRVSTLYIMKTRVAKWGNSLALRLPKAISSSFALQEGTEIELTEHAGGILLRPAKVSYDLKSLLKDVRPDNRHSAIETGEPVGKEAW